MKDDRTNIYPSDWGIEATDADTSTKGIVIYTYSGGWKKMVKANRPVRNNNPGDLKFSSDQEAREAGALTRDKEGFGVFPDWIAGKRAADNLWGEHGEIRRYTIWTAVERFTETDRKKRHPRPVAQSPGWVDRDGNPVKREYSFVQAKRRAVHHIERLQQYPAGGLAQRSL